MRAIAIILVILLLAVIMPAPPAWGFSRNDGLRLHKEAKELLAESRTQAGKDDAEQKLYQALTVYKTLGEWREAARVSIDLGNLFLARSEYAKAMESYSEAEALALAASDKSLERMAVSNVGLILLQQSEYPKALDCYKKALSLAIELDDRKGQGRSLYGMGLVYRNWGRLGRAQDYLIQALALSQDLHDRTIEGRALKELGITCGMQGEIYKGIEYLQKSLKICREIDDHRGEGFALTALGQSFVILGRYDEALQFHEQALEVKKKHHDQLGQGVSAQNIANIWRRLGCYSEAAEYMESSLEISRAVDHKAGVADSLVGLGRIKAAGGDHAGALQDYQQVLKVFQELKKATTLPLTLMAEAYLDMGRIDDAESYAQQSSSLHVLGRVALRMARFIEAKGYYERVLASAEKSRNAEDLFTGYTGLGKAYEGMEQYEKSADYYERGMKLIEEIRSGIPPAERKNFFDFKVNGFARSDPAKGLTRVRLKLNRGEASLESSEATRARAFADGIALRSSAGFSGVPEHVLKQEEDLVLRVAALKMTRDKIGKDRAKDVYGNLAEQVENAEKDLTKFVEDLHKHYPAYAAVKYPRPISLAQSALRADETVIMFDVSEPGVGVTLIRNKQIAHTVYTAWPSDDLAAKVREFRTPFEERKHREFDFELAHTFYQRLIMPVLAQVPRGTPIIIIPDGILNLLPFEALVVEGTPTWNSGSSGPYPEGVTYFGDCHPVSYCQSITALTLSRRLNKTEPRGRKTLVVADPVFEKSDPRAKAEARQKLASRLDSLPERLLSIRKQNAMRFDRLPLTRDLAGAIQALYLGETDALIGLKANKATLLSMRLEDYRHIVFATHGYFGYEIPIIQEPVLALTLINQAPGSDGFLRMTEVMGLALNADVVALTACQTGLGRNASGEGVMSMGRAFQYAGARSVLMSLWSVSEGASVDLMQSFFKHLKEGKNKLAALGLARTEIRRAGYEHPFYWAAFVFAGETQ